MGYYYLDLFEKLMSQCMNRIEYILYVMFVYNIYDTYTYVHIYATKTADNMFLGTVILGEEVNFYYMSYS